MDETRELTCIGCPMGCQITVEIKNGEIVSVAGYTCGRGELYARKEVSHPARIVTSSVPVKGSSIARMVSVKTAGGIPKDRVFTCMEEIRGISLEAPVEIGDVILKDAAGTGVDVVATKNA